MPNAGTLCLNLIEITLFRSLFCNNKQRDVQRYRIELLYVDRTSMCRSTWRWTVNLKLNILQAFFRNTRHVDTIVLLCWLVFIREGYMSVIVRANTTQLSRLSYIEALVCHRRRRRRRSPPSHLIVSSAGSSSSTTSSSSSTAASAAPTAAPLLLISLLLCFINSLSY